MPSDRSFLLIYRHSRKIPHMLIRSCQLIKKCSLTAVLITGKCKSERFTLGNHISDPVLPVILSLTKLTHSRMCNRHMSLIITRYRLFLLNLYNFNLRSLRKPQRQLIPAQNQLNRVTHRSRFPKQYLSSRRKPHIQKMMSQFPLTTNTDDPATLSSL